MLRIYVADDAKEDLLLVDRILRQCKILNPVTLCASAPECIEHLKAMQESNPEGHTALVLLDLIMPPGSGLDVLRFLNTTELRKDCLVVMLSGLTDVRAINEGYQLGAKTFLLKPLTCRDMVELVNSLADITVEQTGEGYLLHRKDRLPHESELRSRTARIMALAA